VLALALAMLRAATPAIAVVAVVLVVTARRRILRRTRIDDADVALPLDLLGGALACGCMPAAAAMAAASAAPPVAAEALRAAATRLFLGEDPGAVWALVAVTVPALADGARACARAAATGAAVADELHRLAAAARSRAQIDRRRRLQRAAVWLVLPLGFCFLPAFVLVGVVPVVVGAVPSVLR
jgi:Flp pilus assembly protein TadB